MDDVRGGFVLKAKSDEPPARRRSLSERSSNFKDSLLKVSENIMRLATFNTKSYLYLYLVFCMLRGSRAGEKIKAFLLHISLAGFISFIGKRSSFLT